MKEPVCLIIPPSGFLADAMVFMSIGPLKVAASLEAKGHTVTVLDLSAIENYCDAVADFVRTHMVSIYGISVTTPQAPSAKRITETIKSLRSEATVIWGGPHVTVTNAARKKEVKRGGVGRAHEAYGKLEDIADILVSGDGEIAIFQAILPNAPKLIDGDDPDSELFLSEEQLGELPPPARHLINMDGYHYYINGVRSASLIMQLGCSFGCRFCSGRLSPSFRRVRIRSIDSVLREIESIYRDYNIKGYMLYDDELNLSPSFISDLNAICDLQDRLGESFVFRGFLKSNLFNEEQAKAMKRANFAEACVGFESASPRILKNIKKQATVDQNTRCIEIAKKYGIRMKAFCSCGHPGDSAETIAATHDWLISVGIDDFDLSVISPFPGTPYFDDAKQFSSDTWLYEVPENGDRLYMKNVDYTVVEEFYKGKIDGGYHSHVYTDFLSQEDLVRMRDWAERGVRNKLNLPFYKTRAATLYDHSIGQLPSAVLMESPI